MPERQERERLNHLRKLARELAQDAKDKQLTADLEFIQEHHLAINPGHLQKMREIVKSKRVSIRAASTHLREQIQHDDLDFTLPDVSIDRMKKIISICIAVSTTKTWENSFQDYLKDGNEGQLLDLIETLSWSAFFNNQTFQKYCAELLEIPKLKVPT